MKATGLNDVSASVKCEPFRIMITGAALVPEALQLLKSNNVEAIYAKAYASSDELAELARECRVHAILVRQGEINAKVINASPELRVIAKHGSGVNNIDLIAASMRRIPVLRALAANSQSVAELAIAHTVALMKDIAILDRVVKEGGWPKTSYKGRDLAGALFGVIGFGEIGQRTASLAKALGMKVIAYDPFAPSTSEVEVTRDLDSVIQVADILSLHCPLIEDTHHLIDRRRLALMKPTAFLVNTARGAIVDENALVEALRDEKIAGAALDSFELEPPQKDHPLWDLSNVIVSPHVGGASESALRNVAVQSVSHILDVLQGRDFDKRALANQDLNEFINS